jgi:hypothetical protein
MILLILTVLWKQKSNKRKKNQLKPKIDWELESQMPYSYELSSKPKLLNNSLFQNELEGLSIIHEDRVRIKRLYDKAIVNLYIWEEFERLNKHDIIGKLGSFLKSRKLNPQNQSQNHLPNYFPCRKAYN